MRIGFGFRRFLACRKGGILVFFAMAMAIFFGFTALSFDIGRVAATQSELQSFADSVALAAAGELDGGADATVRAQGAAENLITDSQTFGGDDQDLDELDWTLSFHSALPDNDQDAIASIATDPTEAVYARVVVSEHAVGMNFASAFAALTDNAAPEASVAAEAVAGFTRYACDITPMFFCLPQGEPFEADKKVGEMILLRAGGGGAGWGPGNFGWLNTADAAVGGPCEGLSSDVKRTECQLAATRNRAGCFLQGGVVTKPGQNEGQFSPALNARFDIYEANSSMLDNPLFAPAPNIVQGRVISRDKNKCEVTEYDDALPPETVPLPWDDCFGGSSDPDVNTCGPDKLPSRFGDGNIDWETYLNVNHGGVDPTGTGGTSTRYEMYLAEIEKAGGATSTDPILSGVSETGRPQCSAAVSPDPDRRVIVAAGVDCTGANGPSGKTELKVKEFFKLFLTHPVGVSPAGDECTNCKFDIWAEVIGSAQTTGGGGIIHDVVQLYR